MKVTTNTKSELEDFGFEFKYSHKDDEVHYEELVKKEIIATVDYKLERVFIEIEERTEPLFIDTMEELKVLERFLYGAQ